LEQPDELTLRFTSLGFSTGGALRSEDAATYQQEIISRADLGAAIIVPMGSRIEAIIYDGATMPAALPPGMATVALPGRLTMLPVTDEVALGLDQAVVGDDRISPAWVLLRQPVAALARQVSAGRRALYIADETFGGEGTQEAIGWQDGRLWYGPSGTCDIEADLEPGYHLISRIDGAINAGLRALGVRTSDGRDEFETIGLTRHRHTEDWIQQR
jgi:hypothetical protein